jgi:hypothetical protein
MAVVFFAGHGIEVGGENWLIPIDAELKSDLDAEHEAISLKSIMAVASTASKLGLVVLDSCRINPFAAKMRRLVHTRSEVARGLVRVEPLGSVLVAYAAKDGTTAADGAGRNSPYTKALLRHLETPGLEINFLFRNVRDDVLIATKRAQEPFVYGSLAREQIYLKTALTAPTGPSLDEIAWTFVQDSKDPNQLRRFIEQFPDSTRRPDAERRIVTLEEAATAKEVERPVPNVVAPIDRRELARLLQLELQRVGCFSGSVDGNFDATTRSALRNFAKVAAANVSDADPTLEALNAIRRFSKRVCPLACQPNERAEGERCVRIVCPAGQAIKDGKGAARPGAAEKSKGKCFSFQGREFCE